MAATGREGGRFQPIRVNTCKLCIFRDWGGEDGAAGGWSREDGGAKGRSAAPALAGGAAALVRCTDWCTAATLHQVVPESSMAPAWPPASCHLSYLLPEFLGRWRPECSVTVSTSGPVSYFCVVGWGPGGYSGILQLEDGRCVALFNMCNRGAVSVEEVQHGPGVLVSTFGKEGTGLKAMAACAWWEGVSQSPSPCRGSPRARGRRVFCSRWRPTGGRARGLATSALGPALVCRAHQGMVGDGMGTVGPGLKEPCDVKRVGSDDYDNLA